MPTQKISDQSQPCLLALLRMELRSRDVVPPDDCHDLAAIVSSGDEVSRVDQPKMIAVNKIGMRLNAEPGEQGVRGSRFDLVPPHMRDFQMGISWGDWYYLPTDPAQSFGCLEFASA